MYRTKKVEGKSGNWIVLSMDEKTGECLQVHSNGTWTTGIDDRRSLTELIKDARNGELHVQMRGDGVLLTE